MNNLRSENYRELFLLFLAVLIPITLLVFLYEKDTEYAPTENTESAKIIPEFNDKLPLVAESVLVTELNTGKILYSKNHEERQPIASLTKLFTSLVAIEKLNRSNKDFVQITPEHLTPDGDWGLSIGDNWSVKKLIDFTLLTSSNDGAKALASSAFNNIDRNNNLFISEMNTFSRKIGLQDTYFLNETGLDMNLETEAGAYSNASDITKILRYIAFTNPGLFDGTSKEKESFFIGEKIYNSENTNTIVNELPGLLISKTGYTDIAGGNLAVVVDTGLNNPVSIVVLGSTKEGRFDDVRKLYNETINYYSQ